MLGAGMILGAPSLPKLTPHRRDSAGSDPVPASAGVRRNVASDSPKSPRIPEPTTPPTASPAPRSSPARRSSGLVAVPGTPPPSPTVAGRPSVVVHRVVAAAVRLHPEERTFLRMDLGDRIVELTLRGGILRGTVEVPGRADRDAVASQLDQFRSALERRGVRVGELQVVVSGDSSESVSLPCSLRARIIDFWA